MNTKEMSIHDKNEYLYNLLKEPLELSSYCRKFTLTVEFGYPPIVEQEHEAKVIQEQPSRNNEY